MRARHEYGSDVRIVKADKVRSGGVGGFFAREHFELSIEVDDASGGSAAGGDAASSAPHDERPEALARPVSLLDLADAISARESGSAHSSATPRSSATPGSSATPRTTPARAASTRTAPAPASTSDEAAFAPGIPRGPSLSTDGATFANILAGLTETVADRGAPAPKPLDTEQADDDERAGLVVRDTRNEVVVASRPTLADPPPRVTTHDRPERRSRGTLARPLSLRDLRDIGLPRELLPAREDGDLLSVLVGALRSLPPVPQPPRGAGEIFAVVGEGEGAWDAGVELARSIDLDERCVVYVTEGAAPTKVAPSRRITAIEQLPSRIDRWRKRPTPTVAVVDAPMNVKAARWNRLALTALCAEAVWLVVPATRKTDDVARWASRLGHTDGLVVTDVDASSDPASVLHLGMPVAWLDGRPATPGAWAGLIVDRLVEAR